MHPPDVTAPGPQTAAPLHAPARGWLTPGRFAFLLGLLIFVAFPAVALGLRTFVFRDFGLFSYPVAFFAHQSFWHAELPFWNSLNHCGLPFLAQWNTMVLYPPSLLYLIFPLGWALSFFCLLHLFWGGLGMFYLTRELTDYPLAAGLAGVLFAFNGLALNFLMWPSHVATFSWAPWVLWLAPLGWRGGGRTLVIATAAAALQMLAGAPETILVTWILLAVLALIDLLRSRSPAPVEPAGDSPRVSAVRVLSRSLAMGVLVALICAIQLAPFLVLLAHSQRDQSYFSSTHDWAMPLWGWANFLIPLFRTNPTSQGVYLQNLQYWTSSYYVGIGSIWLALVGVCRTRDWRIRSLAVACFACLVLAWGNTSVLFTIVRACFPGLGFVRYPVKFVILPLIVFPLLAGYGLSLLVCKLRRVAALDWLLALLLLTFVGVIIISERAAGPDIWHVTFRNGLSRAAFLCFEVLVTALIVRQVAGGLFRSKIMRILPGAALLGVFYLDLVTHVPNQNPTVSPEVYGPLATAQVRWSQMSSNGSFRAMISPGARQYLSQNPLADPRQNQLRNRLAGRADANLLNNTSVVDGFYSLVPREAWRITSLPYDYPTNDFEALLDFLSVAQVTKVGTWTEWSTRPNAAPMVTAGQRPVFGTDAFVFETLCRSNIDLHDIVCLPLEARQIITAEKQSSAHISSVTCTSQKITFYADAPAATMIVLSQTYYPGWKAYVDGHETKIWRANYAFQALELPAGEHLVSFRFEDMTFWLGASISCLGVLLCGWTWRRSKASSRQL